MITFGIAYKNYLGYITYSPGETELKLILEGTE